MKLNHLILVICTGILVGFSACKKDPFTEADAIAAQKELITLKYGYELQLKNIEAAIQKAHDDAAITMKNLEIKGASDLEKQRAAQQIAYLLASLQAERENFLWYEKYADSVRAVLAKRKSDSTIEAQFAALATTYNTVVRFTNNGVAVSGVTVKILRFDNTYFTGTSDANGYLYVKNEKFLAGAPAVISKPSTEKEVYPITYTTPSSLFANNSSSNFPLLSYNPTNLDSIKGSLTVITSLQGSAGASSAAAVGAGYLVKATSTINSTGTLPGDTTSIKLEFITSTLSTGAYKLDVPKAGTGTAISSGYTVSAPLKVTSTIKGYTLDGTNPYQALPTVGEATVSVTAGAYGGSFDTRFNPTYFLSLPNSDHPGGYSVTLTDPLLLIPQLLSGISSGGGNTPQGVAAAGTSLDTSKKFTINPAAFLLNNGHLSFNVTNDTNVYYNSPEVVTLDSTKYLAYMALPVDSSLANANTTLTVAGMPVTKSGWRYQYLTDQINNVPAATLLTKYGSSTVGVWTPTIASSSQYGNDTLEIDFIDLTGSFVNDEPEFYAVVTPSNAAPEKGKVTSIILARGQDYGQFNISGVFASTGATGTIRYPRTSLYRMNAPDLSATAAVQTNTATTVTRTVGTVNGGATASFVYGSFTNPFKSIIHNATTTTAITTIVGTTVTYNVNINSNANTVKPWINHNGTQWGEQTPVWSNTAIVQSNN